ncbi:MAG: hypothetical protein KDE69_06170, partial [Burkholderiaceae bacterium]|nr:hypothetical protein [Burkholderiaceae bacterium]
MPWRLHLRWCPPKAPHWFCRTLHGGICPAINSCFYSYKRLPGMRLSRFLRVFFLQRIPLGLAHQPLA